MDDLCHQNLDDNLISTISSRSCYESNGYDVEEYAHPDEEDPRERSILPADMQGPPPPLLSEAQQSRPPANEEDEERETVTQQTKSVRL